MRRPLHYKYLITHSTDESVIMADQKNRCAMGDALAQG
jgi:hypothetical protein